MIKMNLQFFGGRGSGSGKSIGGNANIFNEFTKAGVPVLDDEVNSMNMTLVNNTLRGVKDTLNEFGLPITTVNAITLSGDGQASMNGFNQLGFGKQYNYKNISEFKKSDYTIDYTAYGAGTHETGHLITNIAMRNSNSSLSELQFAKLRNSGSFEKKIINQAKKKNNGIIEGVSKYANKKGKRQYGETIAEAVSDYMKNRNNASSSSKAIVDVLRGYL